MSLLEPRLIPYRTFRNGDPPQLAHLWNRSTPDRGVVRPISAHEFDAVVAARFDFDPRGLIIAEQDGIIVGFAHAGFGPVDPVGPSHRFDPLLGTVAMLVVDPTLADSSTAAGLLARAEGYLRERGAQVIYAGGRFPLDPFYRSIYGGSEWSGILNEHTAFRCAVEAAGYAEAARARIMEFDLNGPDVRDPKAAVLRRQVRFETVEDIEPAGWWESMAIGYAMINGFRLIRKADNFEVAQATTWSMEPFGRLDGRRRVGLLGVEVVRDHRRHGFGRYLVSELIRHIRTDWGDILSVTTDETNTPALALYAAAGFQPATSATLYRKPG